MRHMTNPRQSIVVVDDDAGMNLALERLLNAAGFNAVMFPSAEALLQTDAAGSAACLILDIHLPGLSGFELNRQLQQSGMTRPVIFITAYEESDFHARAQDAGAIACFSKPFPGKSLLEAISRAVATKTN